MVNLPDADILFSHFAAEAGSLAAARSRFQSLATALVAIRHPDANEVAGPGGTDWGIDTYVGSLAGDIFVWQSKFFPTWNNDDPQKQVRDSFSQLQTKASEEGLTVSSWTLCVPCILAPEQQLWFDRWAVRKKRETGTEIEMWNGLLVRRYLQQPDARQVLGEYFPTHLSEPLIEGLETTSDLAQYDNALFVRQLTEAKYMSTDSARGTFFAAEVVARDVIGRGDNEAIMGLREVDADIHNAWETKFNSYVGSADADGCMLDLVADVLQNVSALENPTGLRLRPAHRRGFMHRVVDDRRAGWVTHWKDVVREFDSGAVRNSVAPGGS